MVSDSLAGRVQSNWLLRYPNHGSIHLKCDPFSGITKFQKAPVRHLTNTLFKVSYYSILNHQAPISFRWSYLLVSYRWLVYNFSSNLKFKDEAIFRTPPCTSILFACVALNLLLCELLGSAHFPIFNRSRFRASPHTLTAGVTKKNFTNTYIVFDLPGK